MKEPVRVGMSEYKVAHNPEVLMCQGLGSCVGIVLYDPAARIGALAHIMLPYRRESKDRSNPKKFADSAMDLMVNEMVRAGASRTRIEAKIFGGANMFPHVQSRSLMNVGEKNIAAVKEELERRKIEITAEEIRGEYGRTVVFDTRDGTVRVRTVKGEERVY